MNLHAVKQTLLSQKMMELQRRDAELAFNQNQSIKRLTVLNMVYLPATFIAVRMRLKTFRSIISRFVT
jgi:Mg2+ and Co2+ transporter CorA